MKGPHVLRHKETGHFKATRGIYRSTTVEDVAYAQVWKGSGAALNARPNSYRTQAEDWEAVPVTVTVTLAVAE